MPNLNLLGSPKTYRVPLIAFEDTSVSLTVARMPIMSDS